MIKKISSTTALALGIGLLLALSLGLSWYHSERFEREITTAIDQRLTSEGLEVPQLEVRGRSVFLKGNIDARMDRERIVELIETLPGVNSVNDQRTVTNYARGRRFELHSYAGITTIEGELPRREDVDLVLNTIRDHFGTDPLGANLVVHPAVKRPPWLNNFARMLHILAAVSPLEITYEAGNLRIAGTLTHETQNNRLTAQLNRILSGKTSVSYEFEPPQQSREPEILIEFANGSVRVEGVVPNREFSRQLGDSLRLAFAVENVDNRLKIDKSVRDSEILNATLRAVFPLAIMRWVRLDIKNGEIRVRGAVASDDELEIIRQQLKENFGYGARLVNLISRENGSG